jgi:hypothetical protein
LISLETAKEKIWKSLEKFAKSLEFPWNFLGKVWKSLKKLGVTAAVCSTQQWPALRRRAKPSPRVEAEENRHATS